MEVEKYLKDNNLSITDLKTDCNSHYLQEVILNLRKKNSAVNTRNSRPFGIEQRNRAKNGITKTCCPRG